MAEDDAIERGFQLAYFIFADRMQALRVLAGALNKLSLQQRRERRRAYWRDKHLKRGITRLAHQDADTLQWLILFESDRPEREQESRGEQTAEDMALRYIKSLVRITTAMSSFYVNVGLHRLLHNYTTSEIQRVYETVTDRYLGTDEYRRAKSVLMSKLERRFGRMLRTFKTQYGELRFEPWEEQEPWRALAETCLKALTPWSTAAHCPVPEDFAQDDIGIAARLAHGEKMSPDELETNRCHVFIDPTCYNRLTRALAFEPPEQKLALPRFFMDHKQNENKSDPPPPLTPEERKALNDQLTRESRRRRDFPLKLVRVVIDGADQGIVQATRRNELSLTIEEGTEMIELFGRVEGSGEDLLLAAHRIRYTEAHAMAAFRETELVGRSNLRMEIVPGEAAAGDQPHRATVKVTYEPAGSAIVHSTPRWFWSFSRYAAVGLALLVVGWIGGTKFAASRPQAQPNPPAAALVGNSAAAPQPVQSASPPEPARLIAQYRSYTLVSDDEIERGAGGPESSSIPVPSKPTLLRLDLPLPLGIGAAPLLATLRVSQRRSVLLTQFIPRAAGGTAGIVSLWVSSTLLRSGQDYSIELTSVNAKGARVEELSSYTLKTVSGDK